MALADNRKGFWPVDPNHKIRYYPVKATQTIARGDCVSLDTGQVDLAVAGDARLLGVCAQEAASLAAGTLIGVWVAGANSEFYARQDASATLAVGDEQDLVGGTGAMQIDDNASSTDVFRLVREVDASEADGAGKRWIVIINKPELAAID